MRRFTTSGRLAAVGIALLVVAPLGLAGCTREVTGSPVEAGATLSVDLDTALLDADDVDDIMGTSGFEIKGEGDTADDTIDVDPPACHGVVYIAGEIEYAPTNFTAMRWRIAGHEQAGGVVEMIAELPSVARADQFIDDQTTLWKGCADEVITSTDKTSGETTQDRVTAIHGGPHTVIASSLMVSGQVPCQHVLQAVSNVVLDVSVCGDGVSDEAETMATKIADRIQAGDS